MSGRCGGGLDQLCADYTSGETEHALQKFSSIHAAPTYLLIPADLWKCTITQPAARFSRIHVQRSGIAIA